MGADPEIEDARALLRWIEAGKSAADSIFSRREAQTANPTKFPKVTDLDPSLKLLEAHGYIREVKSRRRDSRKYEINPAVWDSEKRKIKKPETFSSFSTSRAVGEVSLTNERPTAETAELYKDSDFVQAINVNGSHPIESTELASKTDAVGRRQLSI